MIETLYQDSFGVFSDDFSMFFRLILCDETPTQYQFMLNYKDHIVFCWFPKEIFSKIDKIERCYKINMDYDFSIAQKDFLNIGINSFFENKTSLFVKVNNINIFEIIPLNNYEISFKKIS